MIDVRRSADRGHGEHGWLTSAHTFSFADYYDARQTGFGALRVINEDRVQPARGFGVHGHRNMEIVSYVLSGALEHRDSLGTGAILRAGDVQRISAGSGVEHSEFNASATELLHFIQVWIEPQHRGGVPDYAQRHFDLQATRGALVNVINPAGAHGALSIGQDASLYIGALPPAAHAFHTLHRGRRGYVQVTRGSVHLNGCALSVGDGARITAEEELEFRTASGGEVMLFDLA